MFIPHTSQVAFAYRSRRKINTSVALQKRNITNIG